MPVQAEEQRQPTSGSEEIQNTRGVLAFPRIYSFNSMLMDRLHMILSQFFLDKTFTLFINAIPRDHEEGTVIQLPRYDNVMLTYVGIKKQREMLEGPKEERDKVMDKYWNALDLDTSKMESSDLSISSGFFTAFKTGEHTLADIVKIGMGTLDTYFEYYIAGKGEEPNKWVEYEYLILEHYLKNISIYRFLSVPLIQFAEFDGVVHIVYNEDDHQNLMSRDEQGNPFISLRIIGNIIKAFSREYEGLILDWDTVGGVQQKRKTLEDALKERIYHSYHMEERTDQLNPILDELGYREYYIKHKKYFDKRLKYSAEIPLSFRSQYHQNAIMSILIDSYAHNISAHSLTALEWWFLLRDKFITEKSREQEDEFIDDYPDLPVVRQIDYSLEGEIRPLLRFLLDKGAFWTGLTREANFGGKISSLYSVLWYDFINNPLYLGTIAYSEGITRINIHLSFLETLNVEKGVKYRKKVKLDGNFVSIDLKHYFDPEKNKKENGISHFIIKGAEYQSIQAALKQCRVFFPGGVVGRHAFFTILENELRNVKHFPLKILEEIQKEGLTLNISVENDSYQFDGDPTYFKIGVWLRKSVDLKKGLLLNRLEKLWGDITIGDDQRPRLGGIFQDKVCAAMLFNNSFSSVQDDQIDTFEDFYPWVKVGCCYELGFSTGDTIDEMELSARRYYNEKYSASKAYFDHHFKDGPGYYKKFFHIWKGENIYHYQPEKSRLSDKLENLSRFRFIYLQENDSIHLVSLRERGIIRIIHKQAVDAEGAYREWLRSWLKNTVENYSIMIVVHGEISAQLDFDGETVTFYNKAQLKAGMGAPKASQKIDLVHGTKQEKIGAPVIRYRNHTTLKTYFCNRQEIHLAKIEEGLAAELLEVLATRICIFDNRIAKRLEKANEGVFTNQLFCTVHNEDPAIWEEEKAKGFFNYHFLVIHLSFIEAIPGQDGQKKYKEEDIQEFVEDEVLQGKEPPENFILVITTGRGRTHWWSNLKGQESQVVEQAKFEQKKLQRLPYTAFVTFRPVESLIAAVENSLNLKDDIELKHRLVKILFGS